MHKDKVTQWGGFNSGMKDKLYETEMDLLTALNTLITKGHTLYGDEWLELAITKVNDAGATEIKECILDVTTTFECTSCNYIHSCWHVLHEDLIQECPGCGKDNLRRIR